ncbi:unnamed protein product [Cylicocyclus nassatus]|uniref:Uncharacterized protein n=1 Tax=Cylicocyclus nassatus TaxID=53992 RepID=A0AA36H2V1_CYLNA|nr:unnamed protein product [Cylicocyclus nassatus]
MLSGLFPRNTRCAGFLSKKKRHHRVCTRVYVLVVVMLCSLFPVVHAVWGWLAVNDDEILFCNPPVGLIPELSRPALVFNYIISSSVVACYAAIIGLIHFKVYYTSINSRFLVE